MKTEIFTNTTGEIVLKEGLITVQPGEYKKTSNLRGCFVPIVEKDSEIMLGHYGPAVIGQILDDVRISAQNQNFSFKKSNSICI